MGLFGNSIKKDIAIDKEMRMLGFIKKEDTDAVVVYCKKNEVAPFNHVIMISRRMVGVPLIRSEDRKVNSDGENNAIPIPASVLPLIIKKIMAKGWDVISL